MTTRRVLLSRLVLAGSAALLAACATRAPGVAPASAPTSGPTIPPRPAATVSSAAASVVVYGPTNEPGGFNPLLPDTGSSSASWELLFESLVTPDPMTGAPSPGLAQRWQASPDGLTWTFHIRPDVMWSDGQPFTAADAAFTFDAIADPTTGSPRRGVLANLGSYDAPDPATFRVTLKQPDCPFLVTTMLTPIVPRHLLSGVADLNTDEFNSSRPVGTGPFLFGEWKRGQQVTLNANPAYWGGRPKVDQWIHKPTPNKQTLAAQLKLGEIDYGSVSVDAIDNLASAPNLAIASVTNPTTISIIAYNLERPLFQDKRVRQALTHALDRTAIVDTLLYGQGEVLNSPIAPVSWASSASVPTFGYDPAAAQRLLKDAGWTPGDGGILEKDGRSFSFRLSCNNANPQRLAVVTIAQDAWRKIGVQAQPEILDGPALRAKYQQSRDFDAIIEGGPLGLTNDPDQSVLWASSAIPDGTNFVHYSNPAVDALLAQARAVAGCAQADRRAPYERAQQLIADDQPFTFLYSAKTTVAYNKRVRNVAQSPWIGSAPYVAWSIKDWVVST